ncbi:hypothetical protein JOC77_002448 [Peribacillus deserti]|uniref:Uncharacterized protein n=1 Tax=Peribacillus deserti TaxID=673318 RepID=A0ABS2QIP8_9BACI|nr:hypothetical protein [Peribacillus deserti]
MEKKAAYSHLEKFLAKQKPVKIKKDDCGCGKKKK